MFSVYSAAALLFRMREVAIISRLTVFGMFIGSLRYTILLIFSMSIEFSRYICHYYSAMVR